MMRREGTRGPFAMDEQGLELAIDHVLFDLGDVVRDVVDEVHVEVIGRRLEDFGKGLPRQERHARAVHPRVVGCRAHS